jgi:hypothetical protein
MVSHVLGSKIDLLQDIMIFEMGARPVQPEQGAQASWILDEIPRGVPATTTPQTKAHHRHHQRVLEGSDDRLRGFDSVPRHGQKLLEIPSRIPATQTSQTEAHYQPTHEISNEIDERPRGFDWVPTIILTAPSSPPDSGNRSPTVEEPPKQPHDNKSSIGLEKHDNREDNNTGWVTS